jgi:heat shock protein HslJ
MQPTSRCFALVFLVGCAHGTDPGRLHSQAEVDPANATYTGIYEDPVTLTAGRYEGPPFFEDSPMRSIVDLVDRLRVRADLDGDGDLETAVLLVENSGGTGHFLHIAILDDGQSVSTVLVGDRIQIIDFRADAGLLVMDVVQAGPMDGLCCPTQTATRTWSMVNGNLVEQEETIHGVMTIADISGINWRLRSLSQGKPVPESMSITLFITGQTVSGSSGCNSYTGSAVSKDDPTSLAMGPFAGTKMMCGESAMQWETQFLAALEQVNDFRFWDGDLALSYMVGDDYRMMIFERVIE